MKSSSRDWERPGEEIRAEYIFDSLERGDFLTSNSFLIFDHSLVIHDTPLLLEYKFIKCEHKNKINSESNHSTECMHINMVFIEYLKIIQI